MGDISPSVPQRVCQDPAICAHPEMLRHVKRYVIIKSCKQYAKILLVVQNFNTLTAHWVLSKLLKNVKRYNTNI